MSKRSFSAWFDIFSGSARAALGTTVCLRDSNASLYRNLFDRGHSPEYAVKLLAQA